ncbi:hypothetical protein [Brucella intermedia]|uniref:hypothetical protein n=1 Tax=Brucella intermedia TaxID=94625 RepID=UPI00244ECCFD|nr:hypothetical protein [Brucella intermedia]WGJ08435.1 hypothetical protein QBQ48_19565 [Brucella intermedia]
MTVYAVSRNSQSWYGEQIGILILDAAYPCVPGNVGNATTYTYPVRYQEVRGASIDRLLNQRDPALKEAFVEAALELQGRGVKAITGACGFMAYFQEEVAEAVDIPVFLSSLMQIPFMHAVARGTVGVITANASASVHGISPPAAFQTRSRSCLPEWKIRPSSVRRFWKRKGHSIPPPSSAKFAKWR